MIAVKPALEFTTPFRFLLYRYFIAAILSIGFIAKHWKEVKHKNSVIGKIVGLELIGLTLTLALLYIGLDKTTALEASFISTTAPIFLTLAGILFLHERQEKHEWQGLGLAFLGTVILTVEPFLLVYLSGKNVAGTTGVTSSFLGNALIIGQNLTTTVYFILAKTHYRGLPKLFVSGISFWVGLISFALLSLWETGWSVPSLLTVIISDWQHPSVWFASWFMAVFGSIIGLTAYIHGQEHVEASEASLFWYLQPLVFVPLGIILLHEKVTVWQTVALVIIGLGVWLAQKKFSLVKFKKMIA